MTLRNAKHLPPWSDVVGLVALVVASAVVVSPLFQPGYPSSWDGAAHFVRSRAMIDLFLPKGRTDGWCPYWHNGFLPFVFYPNLLFFLANGLIYYALGTTVSALTIFKVLTAASYVLLPPATYFAARCFRVPRFGAMCAAVSILSVSAIHGVGLQGIFSIGLIPNAFALPLFLVALGTFHLAMTMGGRYVPVAAAAASLVVCAHFICGVYLGFALAIYLVMALRYRRRPVRLLKRAVVVALSTAGMFLMMWLPIVVYREYMGPFADFGDFPFFREYFAGHYLGSRWPNLLAVLFILGVRRWRFEQTFLMTLAVITLPFALGWIKTGWRGVDDFMFHIFRFRGFAMLGLFVALFAGAAADTILRLPRWLARRLVGPRFSRAVAWGLGAVLLGGLAMNVHGRVHGLRDTVKVDAHVTTPEKEWFLDVYRWIRDHAPRPTLIGFDERLTGMGNPGYFQVPSRIVLETDRYSLAGNHLPSTRAHNEEFLRHLHDLPPAKLHALLVRYNVSHVIAWTADVRRNLEASDLFELVHQNAKLQVWGVKGHHFRYASGPTIDVESLDFSAERVTWKVRARQPKSRMTLAVVFHPGWRATVDGASVPIHEAADHLMEVEVPDGTSTVTIVFHRTWWETLLGALALASFLASVASWWWMRRRHVRASAAAFA